jgi:hypothetical protein
LNRAERRRAARLGKIVCLEIFDHLGDLIVRAPVGFAGVHAMLAALGTDRPPQCGACGTDLTRTHPPRSWGLVTRGPEAATMGFCAKCHEGDRRALARAVMAEFGATLVEPRQLHLDKWGRA